jgi:hypothetical protein
MVGHAGLDAWAEGARNYEPVLESKERTGVTCDGNMYYDDEYRDTYWVGVGWLKMFAGQSYLCTGIIVQVSSS